MKALLLLALLLSSCAPLVEHAAQAPRRPRHTYHQAQRRHQHLRSRAHRPYLPWN